MNSGDHYSFYYYELLVYSLYPPICFIGPDDAAAADDDYDYDYDDELSW